MIQKRQLLNILLSLLYILLVSSLLIAQKSFDSSRLISGPKKAEGSNVLKASFYYYPSIPTNGQEIKFYDISTGYPEGWRWSFGDGLVSYEKNPHHKYENQRIYFITLEIRRKGFTSIQRKAILIRSSSDYSSEKPRADFIFIPEKPQVGVPIRFYDKSTGNPTSRSWQFGYLGFSSLKDPVKTFFSNSKYQVTLSVVNQFGSDKITKDIEVGPPPSNIIIAKSCSLKDVRDAIKKANVGDTVIVPNGTARWTSTLIIEKGVILKAATPGGVKIINDTAVNSPTGYGDPSNFVIAYVPSDATTGQPFRLSGFVIDGGSQRWTFQANTFDHKTLAINQFRIDHCTFQHGYDNDGLVFYGEIYGVIDNCILYGVAREFAYNETTWSNFTFNYGSANNRYYEDNTIYQYDGSAAPEGGLGGRYCYRYNTFYHQNCTSGANPWFDMHGNMGTGGNLSTMGAEIYRNVIYTGNMSLTFFDQRGGRLIAFNNTAYDVKGINGAKAREEYLDSLNPPETNPAGQPQHVYDSYYWNQSVNGSIIYNYRISETQDYGGTTGVVPRWDVHCFKHVQSFDGSSGVGVGTLAQRPATCTTEGVGWWATDENKLYRWHNDQWELFYIPYTYPHPLRTTLND